MFELHFQVSPAAERLRYILGEDDDLPTPTLFTEMDTLQHDGDDMEWKESARYTHTHKHTLQPLCFHPGVFALISLGLLGGFGWDLGELSVGYL